MSYSPHCRPAGRTFLSVQSWRESGSRRVWRARNVRPTGRISALIERADGLIAGARAQGLPCLDGNRIGNETAAAVTEGDIHASRVIAARGREQVHIRGA